jgi:hypothetical protein
MRNFVLISDLDDTIKISNTKRKLVTVYRGLFRDSAFTGMATLYNEMLAGSEVKENFIVVSSSPPQIRKRIEKFLAKHKFPPARIVLRDWIREPSVPKYKGQRLRSEITAAQARVILVGDDTEHDPEVFEELQREFGEKIMQVYVHTVTGRKLPANQTPFFTAFDLACQELAAGRLSSEQVLRVGAELVASKKLTWIIPKFSLKPPTHFIPFISNVDQAMIDLWEKIKKRLYP